MKNRICVSMNEWLFKYVMEGAKKMRITKSEFIERAVRQYLSVDTITAEQAIEKIRDEINKKREGLLECDETTERKWRVGVCRRKMTEITEILKRVK